MEKTIGYRLPNKCNIVSSPYSLYLPSVRLWFYQFFWLQWYYSLLIILGLNNCEKRTTFYLPHHRKSCNASLRNSVSLYQLRRYKGTLGHCHRKLQRELTILLTTTTLTPWPPFMSNLCRVYVTQTESEFLLTVALPHLHHAFFCSTTYPISTVHLLTNNIMLSIFRDDSAIYTMHLMPLINLNNNSFFINNVSSLSLTTHQHTFIQASWTLSFTINFINLHGYVFADPCETDERTTNLQNDNIQPQHRPCIWGTEHRPRQAQYPARKKKSWKKMTTA